MTQADQQNIQDVPDHSSAEADLASRAAPEKRRLTARSADLGRGMLERMTMPKYVAWLVAAVAAGVAYFVGTKAGSARYRELSAVAKNVWNDPGVQKVREKAYAKIDRAAARASKRMAT